jgi:hypothetical protein
MRVAQRSQLERELARALINPHNRLLRELRRLLGDGWRNGTVSLASIPDEFWVTLERQYAGVLTGRLERLFLRAAEAQALAVGSAAVVNLGAAEWATSYSFELVRGLRDTSQASLQRLISEFYSSAPESARTTGELSARLGKIFGAVRAEMIAVTEVTRASVEGERAQVRELAAQGVVLVATWQTANDELVCPVCGPRNGRREGDGWDSPPPAHPRCRCWLNHEVV